MAAEGSEVKRVLEHDKTISSNTPAQGALPTAKPAVSELDSLKQIIVTKENLSQVKGSLSSIVEAVADNPSMISRWAKSWGELTGWQKVYGGIILAGPTLAVGLVFNMGGLLALAGMTVVSYSAGAIVLEDHHQCSQHIAENLKRGVLQLGDFLEIIIKALDKIQKDLTHEVERFKHENDVLADNVTNLTAQVIGLTNQIEVLVKTEELLTRTRTNLEQTNVELRNAAETQAQVLEQNQQELERIKKDAADNQASLGKKISELEQIKRQMAEETERAQKVNSTLRSTVDTLSAVAISDKSKQAQFQQKLDAFLGDKKSSFDDAIGRISKTEEELVRVKNELKLSNERHEQLLRRQEIALKKFERLIPKHTKAQDSWGAVWNGLITNGLMAGKPACPLQAAPSQIKIAP